MNSLFTVYFLVDEDERKTGNSARKREKTKRSYECLGMRKLNGNMMGEKYQEMNMEQCK